MTLCYLAIQQSQNSRKQALYKWQPIISLKNATIVMTKLETHMANRCTDIDSWNVSWEKHLLSQRQWMVEDSGTHQEDKDTHGWDTNLSIYARRAIRLLKLEMSVVTKEEISFFVPWEVFLIGAKTLVSFWNKSVTSATHKAQSIFPRCKSIPSSRYQLQSQSLPNWKYNWERSALNRDQPENQGCKIESKGTNTRNCGWFRGTD